MIECVKWEFAQIFKRKRMKLVENHLVLILFFVIHPLVSLGQTSFEMAYKDGKYFITTSLNGHDNIELLVASGFHGIIVSEDDYGRLFVDSLYQTVDSNITGIRNFYGRDSVTKVKYGKVNFYGRDSVTKVKYGKVSIGDLSYQGNIYVVDKYGKINIPVHLLKNEKDTTAHLARLDFKQGTLDFVRQETLSKTSMHQYKMVESSSLPIIETTLFISDTYGHLGRVEGRFLFNLNSGSPLYLYIRNPSALNFIRKNKFRVLPAKDRAGNDVGYGISTAVCQVGERKRRKATIGVIGRINLPNVLGCVGPSLFRKSYVVIDSKNHIMYYE